jgi:hypothetical protein
MGRLRDRVNSMVATRAALPEVRHARKDMTREDLARTRLLVGRVTAAMAAIREALAELEALVDHKAAQLDASPVAPWPPPTERRAASAP